jgi:hypothetical protein
MGQIIVPQSVARKIDDDRARAIEQMDQKRQREKVDDLVKSLSVVAPIEDEQTRRQVMQVCSQLLNTKFARPLAWSDVGRILSDVLLGPGVEYEIKC